MVAGAAALKKKGNAILLMSKKPTKSLDRVSTNVLANAKPFHIKVAACILKLHHFTAAKSVDATTHCSLSDICVVVVA